MLRITIGNVQADRCDVGDGVQDQLDLLKVGIRSARADGNVVKDIGTLLGKGLPLVQRVVLVNAHKAAVLVETLGNVVGKTGYTISRIVAKWLLVAANS